LPSGLVLHEVTLHERSGAGWLFFPSKPKLGADGVALRDERGKVAYGAPLIEFAAVRRRTASPIRSSPRCAAYNRRCSPRSVWHEQYSLCGIPPSNPDQEGAAHDGIAGIIGRIHGQIGGARGQAKAVVGAADAIANDLRAIIIGLDRQRERHPNDSQIPELRSRLEGLPREVKILADDADNAAARIAELTPEEEEAAK
jgi:hypothetical protein